MTHVIRHRLALSALIALLPVVEASAIAQGGPQVTFELRPHCIEADHAAADDAFGGDIPEIEGVTTLTQNSVLPCPSYPVRDPLSKQTDVLKVGDTLDMDLVMHNPASEPVGRFRVWIAYDSTVLEGMSLELADAFTIPTPGEADFSSADNYIKVSASSPAPVTDTKVVLARVILKVQSAPANGVILAFHDANGTTTAHTGAFVSEGSQERNASATVQGALAVRFSGSPSAASAASSAASSAEIGAGVVATVSSVPASSAAITSAASSAIPPIASSAASSVAPTVAIPAIFSKLQVQALRVTTEGSSVFLAWNPLPSAEIVGYNLYYGSISGRYLQRRSLEKEAQTVTVRALPVGMTYYFAVRAVNGAGEESDFSQEVAVTVGNPATSTSPLSGNLIEGPQGNAPSTGGNVAGESGPGTWIALLLGISAVLGTAFAFRRQWTASSTLSR